jgi:hypothetical protein
MHKWLKKDRFVTLAFISTALIISDACSISAIRALASCRCRCKQSNGAKRSSKRREKRS